MLLVYLYIYLSYVLIYDNTIMAERSTSYPAITFDEAFKFTKEIYENFGKSSYNDANTISDTSFKKSYATLKQHFSSGVQYGLIELKKRKGYRVTDLFISIFHFKDEEEKINSIFKSISSPPLYSKVFKEFSGKKLPSEQALRAIFIRDHKISDSASGRAVNIFITNMKEHDYLDEENFLKIYSFGNDENEGDSNGSNIPPMQKLKQNRFPEKQQNQGYRDSIPIFLDDKRTAYLQLPMDLFEEDLEQLKGAIEFLVRPIIKRAN